MASADSLSAIVTVYNGERHLRDGMQSLLTQTLRNFELIVVDDGSTDGTASRLDAIDDPRIRRITHPENRGIPAARNTALQKAGGTYCAFLSHDDIADPRRFETQVAWLARHLEVGVVGSAYDLLNDEGERLRTVSMPLSDLEIRWCALLDCPLRQSSIMVRTALARETEYDERFSSYSDYDFLVRMLPRTKAANLPEALVGYRRHGANASIRHRGRLDAAGVEIACRAICSELPEFEIPSDEVASLRKLLLHGRRKEGNRSLEAYKASINTSLDLWGAFQRKYKDLPEFERIDPMNRTEFE